MYTYQVTYAQKLYTVFKQLRYIYCPQCCRDSSSPYCVGETSRSAVSVLQDQESKDRELDRVEPKDRSLRKWSPRGQHSTCKTKEAKAKRENRVKQKDNSEVTKLCHFGAATPH